MADLAPRLKLVTTICSCAFFLQALDATIVTTALPQIAVAFNTSPVLLSVAITSYVLSIAVFMPLAGWLADRFGACTIFRTAIGIFTICSILCGLSNNLVELTLARILQGMGGALMTPVARLVLLRSIPKSDFIKAMAILQATTQIGPLLGPPLGGFITTYLSWRWIFLMNLPIGLLGIILATIFIENRREGETAPFDWIGFLLTGSSLSCLMFGFESFGRGTSNAQIIFASLGVGFVLGWAAVRHALTASHPIIDLSLIRIPTFRTVVTGGMLFRTGWGSISLLLQLLFQVAFGMTAFSSGMLTFSVAMGSMSTRVASQTILRRFGFRNVLIRNGLLCALLIIVYEFFTPSTSVPIILLVLIASGFVQSMQFTCLNTLAYADIPPEKLSRATTLAQLVQQFCIGFGVAIGAAVLHFSLKWRGAAQLETIDFRFAFAFITIVWIGCAVSFFRLKPEAGAELSLHQPKLLR